MKFLSRTLVVLTAAALPALASAAEIKVAVAANFHGTLQKLAPQYAAASGNTLTLSSGSSGQFYTQITNGAPFDVFLSADAERPAKLEQEGYAVEGTRFIYAIGVPVLWSATPGVVDSEGKVLTENKFKHIAIAEPRNAPYGAAAQEVLTKLGVWDALESGGKVAKGNSIGQTHSQVATGAAELGFVALAQVKTPEGIPGSHWIPPSDLYTPIAQAAVVLKRADDVEAAKHFLNWLRNDPVSRKAIEDAGYGLE
ncbi:molybdate ABC transporter substrate-binding protein [Pseudothauera nasutitermitis]|uniref:Molybdate ABC transporter substrate-binding protein n=1 Tax=Pseudothauera nasutitermitis TaxID=2565930 RepID=A0A4S4AXC7_9RHOO|nr:molybdate ABC transporter substrate-binding protein [Pseudothauera nasutitermitis]THF64704.1 molybdate ABC transporter substrate-binding protein [Pseudothauera nasutitermitis]